MGPKRKRSPEKDPVGGEKDGAPTPCTICMDEISVRGKLSVCSHYFCFTCIHEWSKNTNTCPLCKRRFRCITKVHVGGGKGSPPRKIRIADKDQSMHDDEEENLRVAEEIDAQSSDDSDLYDDDYEPALYNWTNNRASNRRQQNYYDVDDSFIDDSEDEIARQLQMFNDLQDNPTPFIVDSSSEDSESESELSESSDRDVPEQQGSSISRRTRSRRGGGQMSISSYMEPSQSSSLQNRTTSRPARSTRSSNTGSTSNNRGSKSREYSLRSSNRNTSSGANRYTRTRNSHRTASERNELEVEASTSTAGTSSAQSGVRSARVQAEARIQGFVTEEGGSMSTGWRRKVTAREGDRVRKYFVRESTRNSQRVYHYSSDESDDDLNNFIQNTSTPNHRRERAPVTTQDVVPPTPPSRHTNSTRSNTRTDVSSSVRSRTASADATHNAMRPSQGSSSSACQSSRSCDSRFSRKPLNDINGKVYHVDRSHAPKRGARKRVYMLDSDSD